MTEAPTNHGLLTMMIPLSQGKSTIVDLEDYDLLNRYKWNTKKDGNNFYAVRGVWQNNTVKTIYMHRVITNAIPGKEIDHINGDGLDNRKCNLRFVTHRQNGQNKHVGKTSRFPGVTWDKNRKRWTAQLRLNGKRHFLGRFPNEHEAFEAYKLKLAEIGEVLA